MGRSDTHLLAELLAAPASPPAPALARRSAATPRPRRSWLRRPATWLTLALALAVGGGLLASEYLLSAAAPQTTAAPLPVPVERRDLTRAVRLSGTLEPRAQQRLSLPEGARIVAVPAREGERVEAGQPLIQLDSSALEAAVAARRAQAEQLRAQLALLQQPPAPETVAQAELRLQAAQSRLQAFDQSVSYLELDTARQQYDRAQQRLAGLEAGAPTDAEQQAERLLAEANAELQARQTELERAREALARAAAEGREPSTEERAQLQAAEQAVTAAERRRADAAAQAERERTTGRQDAILQARTAFVQAQQTYNALLNNPSRDAERAALLAAVVEATAERAKLLAGPNPAELARVQGELQRAEADVVQAEADLARAMVRAPFAGVVVALNAQPNTQVTAATTVVVADPAGFKLRGQVAEQDVLLLAVDDPVALHVDVLPDLTLGGTVVAVGQMPTTPGGGPESAGQALGLAGSVYPVDVLIDGADHRLRPGLSASAEIQVVLKADAVVVPAQAVRYDEAGAYVLLAKLADATPTEPRRPVETGETMDGYTELLGGVTPGEVVLMPALPSAPGEALAVDQ